MQKITIEVKDDYINNIMEVLHGLNGIMIEKIELDDSSEHNLDESFINLQINSMKETWDNKEDKAWDVL